MDGRCEVDRLTGQPFQDRQMPQYGLQTLNEKSYFINFWIIQPIIFLISGVHSYGPSLPHCLETQCGIWKKGSIGWFIWIKKPKLCSKDRGVVGRFSVRISHIFLTYYQYYFKSFYSIIKGTVAVIYIFLISLRNPITYCSTFLFFSDLWLVFAGGEKIYHTCRITSSNSIFLKTEMNKRVGYENWNREIF